MSLAVCAAAAGRPTSNRPKGTTTLSITRALAVARRETRTIRTSALTNVVEVVDLQKSNIPLRTCPTPRTRWVRQTEPLEMNLSAAAADTVPTQAEHFDVLIVGAGISGIGGAYHLTRQCPDKRFVIVEAQTSFGGT